uniref:Reverse transcriptase domain-containing protein n=1 Tax=Tanacetum cinerariifolium TaxID=118510 RepID=A0A699IK37_TANCI|nr:reverse transcriptase domain-containing protein [Tanacetum cinerariifolium]
MFIFQGNGDNQRDESRLNIISCTKAQEYLLKGCDVFLANVTTKEAKDKSEGKRLEDMPIIRNFPEVFPKDLPAMSSDNAQSAVTYTSISPDSDGPSCGIQLMNAVYVPEPEHPVYHAPSDEDPREDLSEEHEPEDDNEDPEEDPNEEHEPKGSYETEPFEEDEIAVTPPPPRHRRAQLGHRAAMIRRRDDILEEDMPPRRRFALTGPLTGCDVVESSDAAAARAPMSQYNFVDTVEVGQGLICSPGHDTQTIARAADRVEDVGYVRTLQASEHRMMTSIEEVNLWVSYQAQVHRQESVNFYTQLLDAQTDRRDIRLGIDVVRGQRTGYETELQEVHQAYLSSEAQNRALLAIQRNATHTQDDASQSSSGGLRRLVQPARVCSYTDFMKCQSLNFKGTEGIVGLSQCLKKMESVFHISGCAIDNQVKFAACTLLGAALTWWNGHVRNLGHDAAYAMTWGTLKKKLMDKYCPKELALMCTKFLADETEKVDKYISGLPDNIHGNVMCARPKTLDETIELDNDLMDQKLRTYAERQNESKRKANDSPRNNQQQPHKKDASPDSNIIMCTFLLNNRYAKILFDTGADKSFVSTTFSALIDITPTTLENHFDVELADGKIIRVNTIIRGCILNFMNYPFNIDLMPVPLGSFDVISGMDCLTKYHGVIICDKKIVRVPFGREMLIFQGNRDNQREESRLNIISCTKAQEYLSKGCDVFLENVTTKEAKDKSEGRRIEDVPIVRDFPKVFPEDLPGIPPARPVEF